MSSPAPPALPVDRSFRHEALLYAGEDDFADQVGSFVDEALASGEAVLVMVSAAKIERLRSRLGRRAERVSFADMTEVGRNPARIIPVWRVFLDEQRTAAGRGVRGIGEPVWAGRRPDELVECHIHESLLNRALEDVPGFWLACPYDAGALDPAVIAEAHCTHPFVSGRAGRAASPAYRSPAGALSWLGEPLPEPAARPETLEFGPGGLGHLRALARKRACRFGLDTARGHDFVLAASELAANSLRHGGGAGTLRIWEDGERLVLEVSDRGRIHDPLAGRHRPTTEQLDGRGLWLVNQIADLVQIRSPETGTVVRVHTSRDAAAAAAA